MAVVVEQLTESQADLEEEDIVVALEEPLQKESVLETLVVLSQLMEAMAVIQPPVVHLQVPEVAALALLVLFQMEAKVYQYLFQALPKFMVPVVVEMLQPAVPEARMPVAVLVEQARQAMGEILMLLTTLVVAVEPLHVVIVHLAQEVQGL